LLTEILIFAPSLCHDGGETPRQNFIKRRYKVVIILRSCEVLAKFPLQKKANATKESVYAGRYFACTFFARESKG